MVSSTAGAISAVVPGHGVVMLRVSPGSESSVGTTARLVDAASNRCLDVFSNQTAPGTKIEIWDCNGGANQSWTPTAAGELRTYGGTECLDATGNGTTAGTAVVLWPCNGGTNQKWQLRADGTIVASSPACAWT